LFLASIFLWRACCLQAGNYVKTARPTSIGGGVRRFAQGNMDPIAIKVRDGAQWKEIGIL
jgi:hypothetical protein